MELVDLLNVNMTRAYFDLMKGSNGSQQILMELERSIYIHEESLCGIVVAVDNMFGIVLYNT